ncbi:MAG: hypothetical protein LW847_02820 [Burkholderiales bacterium]|jgi:hypothetical protein|nr:hypothetical protein [Burkholderiales bacterium]
MTPRRLFLLLVATVLAGCATLGPPQLTLSRAELAQRAFIDRSDDAVARLFREAERAKVQGPEVSVQVGAQRLVFAWTAPLTATALPLSLRIAVSGVPVLNEARDGIDLADARVEEVSVTGVPFLSLNRAADVDRGQTLGTLPLLRLRPDELTRDGVEYAPTALSVGSFGLRVELQPK